MVTLEIDEQGGVRLLVDGEAVGLIESLSLIAAPGIPTALNVRMSDTRGASVGGESLAAVLQSRSRHYKSRLSQHPFVTVLAPEDTLPSGMPAVKAPKL